MDPEAETVYFRFILGDCTEYNLACCRGCSRLEQRPFSRLVYVVRNDFEYGVQLQAILRPFNWWETRDIMDTKTREYFPRSSGLIKFFVSPRNR